MYKLNVLKDRVLKHVLINVFQNLVFEYQGPEFNLYNICMLISFWSLLPAELCPDFVPMLKG